jgi:hypothetical protein
MSPDVEEFELSFCLAGGCLGGGEGAHGNDGLANKLIRVDGQSWVTLRISSLERRMGGNLL